MLSSITPLGERGRGRNFMPTATAYAFGSIVGAGLLGSVLGLVGGALPASLHLGRAGGWAVAAATAAMGVLLDLRIFGLSLPTIRRQVNENWLQELRGVVTGAGFGFQLGLGVVTIVTSSLIYLLWVVALLTGSALTGLVLGTVFGAARSVTVFAMYDVHRPDQLAAAHRRLAAWARPAHLAALCTGAAVAVFALASAVAA